MVIQMQHPVALDRFYNAASCAADFASLFVRRYNTY